MPGASSNKGVLVVNPAACLSLPLQSPREERQGLQRWDSPSEGRTLINNDNPVILFHYLLNKSILGVIKCVSLKERHLMDFAVLAAR